MVILIYYRYGQELGQVCVVNGLLFIFTLKWNCTHFDFQQECVMNVIFNGEWHHRTLLPPVVVAQSTVASNQNNPIQFLMAVGFSLSS